MVKCPKCKSEHVAPIMYGYPMFEAFEAAERGEIILGGCVVEMGNPDYGCLDCEFRWSKGSLTKEAITKVRFKVVENGPCDIDFARRWVYEIYPSGKTVRYSYIGRDRKYVEKVVQVVTEEKVLEFMEKLQFLVSNEWNEEVICCVCDGCSYELQITYVDGRKERHDGDVGGGTVDTLIMNYINAVFKEIEMQVNEAEIESLINWWQSIDNQGMDVDKYLINPVMDALGEDIDSILEYLSRMEIEDLVVISGCFEDIYRKFTTDEVWDTLEELEQKCRIM